MTILRGFQHEGVIKFIRLSYFDPNMRMKRNVVCSSVCLKRQYVRLSGVDSNMRDEMKRCISVCLAWIAVFGEKET